MEKDINVIVDVDANEAQLLIELLETLFDDWYVAQNKRQKRFRSILDTAAEKEAAKSAPPTTTPVPDPTP